MYETHNTHTHTHTKAMAQTMLLTANHVVKCGENNNLLIQRLKPNNNNPFSQFLTLAPRKNNIITTVALFKPKTKAPAKKVGI